MSNTNIKLLIDFLYENSGESTNAWIDNALKNIETCENIVDTVSQHAATANRMLDNIRATSHLPLLSAHNYTIITDAWSLADIFRTLLYLKAADTTHNTPTDCITSLYRYGDENERACLTRALLLFPAAHLLKQLALETGRTNSAYLFNSIACNNPYPAVFYTAHEFNQLVMKGLFIGLPIANIIGLNERSNVELSRMCEDFIEERIAAKRTVPADIWLAMVHNPSNRGIAYLTQYIDDESVLHRYNTILAISKNKILTEDLREILEARMAKEHNPEILNTLRSMYKTRSNFRGEP